MKIFIISSVLLAAYITLDLVMNEEMWQANTNLTIYLQENQFKGEKEMFLFFSYSLYVLPISEGIAFLFFDNKLGALLYGCMIVLVVAINSLLKNIYHQVRPYWVVQEIMPYECNKEFGKPSGHAQSSSLMCFLFPCIFFPAIFHDQQNKKYSAFVRITCICLLSFWVFMTGLSRVFVGVHSFGQILLGWAYTTYTIVIYMEYFHQSITNYFKSHLVSGGLQILWKPIIIFGIFILFWTLISILFLELNIYVFIEDEDANQWLYAIYTKCQNQTELYTIQSPGVIYNVCFVASLFIYLIFSAFIGVKLSQGIYNEGMFTVNYLNLSKKQRIFRVILFILLGSLVIPFFFIKYESVYSSALGFELPVSILGGLIVTYTYPKLLTYFKLGIDGDFVYIPQNIIDQRKSIHMENQVEMQNKYNE